MAGSTISLLESLPLLVLERICGYLDNDESGKRRSLRAFSLTSRCCCAATVARRFCQIQLKIHDPEELGSGLRLLNEVLNLDGRHRYVRRLKVSWAMADDERRREGLPRQDDETDEDEKDNDWNTTHYFDMHYFCRPSKTCMEEGGIDSITQYPEATWMPLASFISQLPALQDLVWAFGSHMPQSVLSAVSARSCRLHMHCFRLRSLIQLRDSPRPINPKDYALASSLSLSSIVVEVRDFETDGMVNYTVEAVMQMVAGTAPNLAHVCLLRSMAGNSIPHREAIRIGKPVWSGFSPPGAVEADQLQLPVLGSLQSLVFTGYASHGIENWARLTDFTNLRCLNMHWSLRNGVALAEIATRGDFKSLHTLELSTIEDETDQAQEALNQLLKSLNPLQRLEISGHVNNQAFDIVLRRHGGTLRKLSISPYRDEESHNPIIVFSEDVIQRLAEQCPNLEQVWLPVNRLRGDDRETGIYRALSRLPRLRRASLRLWYTIGPDEEYWNEEIDGEHPLRSFYNAEDIPFVYLREAFTNSAIDATLALTIFNLISSGGSLRYLRLEPRRKMGRNAPGCGTSNFVDVLRWFNRLWVCKRDVRGRVTVSELDKNETARAGEEWQYLMSGEELERYGEDIFLEVFKDIWPQKTSEWWKDWESLPLSYGAA